VHTIIHIPSVLSGLAPTHQIWWLLPIHEAAVFVVLTHFGARPDGTAYGTWLGEEEASPEVLVALMRPFDPGRMRAWPVGPRVGAVANQGEDLMAETQPTVNSA
jgi:putative SOS response-associated peptidase YedK